MSSLTVFCSFGLSPRPPSPSGKCTHARPRSNWAPRKVVGSVFLGSCSRSNCSTRSTTSCSSRSTLVPRVEVMPPRLLDRPVRSPVQASRRTVYRNGCSGDRFRTQFDGGWAGSGLADLDRARARFPRAQDPHGELAVAEGGLDLALDAVGQVDPPLVRA